MIAQYQKWLKARKAAGKRLPKDMSDMEALAREDFQKQHTRKLKSRHRKH